MSGATTGNMLNSVEVSLHKDVPNLIVVAGQNELRSDLSDEEFVLLLKEKEARLRALASSKKIAILKPPPQGRIDAVEQAKESFFMAISRSSGRRSRTSRCGIIQLTPSKRAVSGIPIRSRPPKSYIIWKRKQKKIWGFPTFLNQGLMI